MKKSTFVREAPGDAKTMYAAYNEVMADLIKSNPKIIMCYGDYPRGAAGEMATKDYPDRVYDVGIAEANLITVAAGLAGAGNIPFTHCHSIFAVGRAYNQIRQNVAYDKYNVKIMLMNAGMLWTFNGGSHQAIEEIAVLRVIPNMVIIAPADAAATKKAAKAAVDYVGPLALKMANPPVPTIYKDDMPFEIGKANTLTDGKDVTIIACGMCVADALKAADMLDKDGIKARVLDMHTIKPLDEAAVLKAAKETGAIVTVEDVSIIGGMGGAVAELVSENLPVPVKRVGIKDRFGQSANVEELKKEYELSANDIVKAVKDVKKRK